MPIIAAVNAIVKEGADPREKVLELMERPKKTERIV